MVFGDGQIPVNFPIRPLSLNARDFSLEASNLIWILGVKTHLMKLALLEFGPEEGGMEMEATRDLNASSNI